MSEKVKLKIGELNYHDRMELVMNILIRTSVDLGNEGEKQYERRMLSDAWILAYDLRQFFAKQMKSVHFPSAESDIVCYQHNLDTVDG